MNSVVDAVLLGSADVAAGNVGKRQDLDLIVRYMTLVGNPTFYCGFWCVLAHL